MKSKSPCGHRVLVRLKDVEEKSKGGIVLTATGSSLMREQRGTDKAYVEQIGPQAFKAFDDGTPWCQVGDLVVVRQYSGHYFEQEGKYLAVINDEDILCVLEEEDDE